MWSIVSWMGLSLVVLGVTCMRNEHNTILKSQVTDGKVIGLTSRSDSDGGTTYAPKVRFIGADGREIVFEPNTSFSNPGVEIGDAVKVIYQEQNPKKVGLLLFSYRFGGWYSIIGVGLLLIFLGYGFNHGNEWIKKAYPSSEIVRPVD